MFPAMAPRSSRRTTSRRWTTSSAASTCVDACMAKSQLFHGPLGWILRHGGAFPVRRGRGDEKSIETALGILAAGGVIVIYPEGGRSRSSHIGERARSGVGRLALESGAPVIPVAIHG